MEPKKGQNDGVSVKRRRIPRIPRWAPQVFGYLLSAVCLAWVLHGYDLRQIFIEIARLDWKWVGLAVVLDLTVYVCHGWRWNILLRPIARLGLWRTVQAIYIGLFANEVLPLRTGELIRCYLLAHWNDLLLSLVFASAFIERLLDGLWMVLALLATASFVRLPGYIVDIAQVVGGVLIAGFGILVWVIFHKHHAHSVVRESRWAATLRHVIEGLHVMGNRSTLARATGASLCYLILQIISVWALMKAYGLDLSIWAAAGVIVVLRFGTVIPSAPGNLGLFQASCVVALRLFDVESTDAKTFSFVMFFALTLPLLLGGAVAVALTGLRLGEIHHRARRSLRSSGDVPSEFRDGSP